MGACPASRLNRCAAIISAMHCPIPTFRSAFFASTKTTTGDSTSNCSRDGLRPTVGHRLIRKSQIPDRPIAASTVNSCPEKKLTSRFKILRTSTKIGLIKSSDFAFSLCKATAKGRVSFRIGQHGPRCDRFNFWKKRPTFDRRNPKGLLNFPNGKITVSHYGTGIRIINVIVADCLCIEEYGERNLFGAIVCEIVDCFDDRQGFLLRS